MKDIKDKNLPESKFDLELITHNSIVNPFNDITRRARKSLLLTTFIGFATNWAGFIPTKFEPLGITLTTANQNTISVLIVIVLIYFITAFWIYANTDLIRFNIIQQAGKDNIRDSLGNELLINQEYLERHRKSESIEKSSSGANPPKLPPEYFKIAALSKLMRDPISLYKYVGAKVWFDKNVPIISGICCLLFIFSKLFNLPFGDLKSIFISLVATIITLALKEIFIKRKILVKYIVSKYKSISLFFTKMNVYFIGYQKKITKKGSWWNKRAIKKQSEISLKAVDRMFGNTKKNLDKSKKKKKID